MVGFWIRAGKKAGEAIKGVKPGAKFKGQKSVGEVKNIASAERLKAAAFNYKEGIKKALKKMKDIK